MLKKIFTLSLLTIVVAGCALFQGTPASEATVTYSKHIEPIMKAKCTPCHYPETGKVDMLDTYDSVRKHIGGIIYRVQLSPDKKKYMPFKQKKEAMSPQEIALFEQWKAEGFAP